MNRLAGKVSIITGGAGSIGKTTSQLFVREGGSVVIVDVDEQSGVDASEEIVQAGGKCLYLNADVTVASSLEEAFAEAIRCFGAVDVLVNLAGGSVSTRLLETDNSTLEKDIALNLTSAMLCTKAILPHMRERKRGSVIFVSSVNAILGGFSQSSYAAAKAGLHSLSQTLTADYSRDRLRFNTVCLGTIPGDSPRWKERLEAAPALGDLKKMYPLGRFGNTSDASNAFLYLASDESVWVSGSTIVVDGGISATGALRGGGWWS